MDTEQTVEQQQIEGVKYVISELEKVVAGTRTTGWGDSTDIEDNLRSIADQLISISQAGYPDTFRDFLLEKFEKDELRDMYEHGMGAGWAHFTYYSDMLPIYDRYEREIWDTVALSDVVESGYYADDEGQFIGAMVWCMADKTLSDLVMEWDEEDEGKGDDEGEDDDA